MWRGTPGYTGAGPFVTGTQGYRVKAPTYSPTGKDAGATRVGRPGLVMRLLYLAGGPT